MNSFMQKLEAIFKYHKLIKEFKYKKINGIGFTTIKFFIKNNKYILEEREIEKNFKKFIIVKNEVLINYETGQKEIKKELLEYIWNSF